MIHIFYRHYNTSGRENWRPYWFDYERCFLNLLKTTENEKNLNIIVVYDGNDSENFIFKHTQNIIKISAGGDIKSFVKTLEIAKEYSSNLNDDDILYFLENDYLHTNTWVEKVKSFFGGPMKDNYLTLYDHNDKYMEFNHNLSSNIYVTENHHFRTTPSTCGSFLLNKKTFIEDYQFNTTAMDFLGPNTNLPLDHAKFLILSQIKNRKVMSPIPGLSTHCLNNLMSPTINWEKIINE